MRGKKLLKILGVSLLVVITLAAMFVFAFIFNPFEGRVNDLRDLVPRSSQFFLRKVGLTGDFAVRDGQVQFPEPQFWENLTRSSEWNRVRQGPAVRALEEGGLGSAVRAAQDLVGELRAGSNGYIDLLGDLIGEEVILAGRYDDMAGNQMQEPWVCMLTRVSWKVRAGWGLAQWDMVQGRAAEQGITLVEEDGFLKMTPQAGQPVYLHRERDCLMVCTGKPFLEEVRNLIEGREGVESLAQSTEYRAAIDSGLDRWADATAAESVNAVEFSLRPNDVPFFTEVAAGWPDKNHPDSMNQRVLASFLNLSGWRFINGAAVFEPGGGLGVLGQIRLNSNTLTPFQSEFFRAEARPRDEWLRPFLQLVPADACAAVAMRMPAKQFLDEMYLALDSEERQLLDEVFSKTGEYDSIRAVIEDLRHSLQPRIGMVFRRNIPDPDEEGPIVAAPSPAPHIAWVFWLEDGFRAPVRKFVDTLRLHSQTFTFDKVMKLDIDFSQSADPDFATYALEFYQPQIPGTGEIATLIFDRFFIVSNSGPFINQMLQTKFQLRGNRAVQELRSFRRLERELPNILSGFIYLNGPRLAEVMDDFERFMAAEAAAVPDQDFMYQQRPTVEAEVRRARFSEYPTVGAIPESRRQEFDQAVNDALVAKWNRDRASYNAEDRADIEQLKGMCRMLDMATIYFKLESTLIDLSGHFLFDY